MKEKEFKDLTNKMRIDILEMVYTAGSGHIGGSFSIIDILAYIYFIDSNIKENILKYKDEFRKKEFNELTEKRLGIDKLVLSKAHASPAIYTILLNLEAVDREQLYLFRRVNGILEGHCSKKASNFIDYSGGSLGQGFSFSVGIAEYYKFLESKFEKEIKKIKEDIKKSKKENEKLEKLNLKLEKKEKEFLKIKNRKIYAVVGDGELDEGQNYEAMMLASKLELDNLVLIIDRNKVQLDGTTKEIMPLDPLDKKLESFGFNYIEIDGHKFSDLKKGFKKYEENFGSKKPFVIIANTIKGKGINFMEGKAEWHGKAPSLEEYEKAIRILGGFKNEDSN